MSSAGLKRFVATCLLGGLFALFAEDVGAQAVTTTRVSVATGGAEGNSNVEDGPAAVSADGRHVAFSSSSSNLVAGDTNGTWDVFIHDRATSSTSRVSVASGGVEANAASRYPALSADGRYVAFQSLASNLVANDNNLTWDVFVHDRQTGITTLVSVALDGGVGGGCELVLPGCPSSSLFPAISADGRHVSFESYATNLVPGKTTWAEVFVRDLQAGVTSLVSVGLGGADSTYYSAFSSLSADGRYVAFHSAATNLVLDDTNDEPDVFVRDRQTGQTTRVSIAAGGDQSNGPSSRPAISADGRLVTFTSSGTNLVVGDTNSVWDVFVHDRQTATTTRVSVGTGGVQSNAAADDWPAISAQGRYVGFSSLASNLASGDTNGCADVFVYDRLTGTTTRVSVGTGGSQASLGSRSPAFDALGRHVAFASAAPDLVPGDANGAMDVFVYDRGPIVYPPETAIEIGDANTLTGEHFTAGSVIKLYVATAGGAVSQGPFTPTAWTPTSLTWAIPSTVPLGDGFGAVQVVNTDSDYWESNIVGALLEGDPLDNIPTILYLNGEGLGPADPSIGVAHIDTVLPKGGPVTITGTGFSNPGVNLFTATGNVGPLWPVAGDTATQIQVTVPPATPTGPGNFQVVNSPYTGNVQSNAVSAVIGARPTITGVTVNGTTVNVTGTGFCSLSVINLFNLQGATVVNLGGLNGTTAKVPLTIVNDTQFTFTLPAGAVAGPAFVEVLNPPYIPYASSGNDPDGAFTIP